MDLNNPYSDQFYSSQANLNSNNFGGSVNPAAMNPGWGIDPSQMTPSFAAPYRPQWDGNTGSSNFSKPGLFRGMSNLAPWQSYGYTAPQDNWNRNIEGAVESPVSAAAFIAQRIAAPVVAFKVAGKLLGPSSFVGAFRGEGLGAKLGQGAARGFANGVGRGVGLSAASTARLGYAAGVAGSAIGSLALPYAAAMGGLEIAERGVFNPFINQMKTAESLRNNFSGVTFADAQGNAATGRGLGYREAMGISQSVTHSGIGDKMFSTSDYKDLADLSMRSGLLDRSSKSNITKNLKDIAEQVKLVIAVSKDPSIQSAIETLSKLQTSGASGANVGRVYSGLGMKASIAGASIQRMMETVGQQGEYLFRQNGMTPYSGQMAAANSYSSFAAANRMGLISPEQLARMGGIEGATQASLTGQINASQSIYSKFSLYNKYLGGGAAGGGVVGTTNKFANSMSADPFGTYGAMQLYGGQMSGKFVAERGAKGIEDLMMGAIRSGNEHLLDKNGKISAERAVPFLMNQGMSMDQIQAFLQERMNDSDPRSFRQKRAGMNSFVLDQQKSILEQTGGYGSGMARMWNNAKTEGSAFTNYVSRNTSDIWGSTVAKAEDWLGMKVDKVWSGDSLSDVSLTQQRAEFNSIMNPGSTANSFDSLGIDLNSVGGGSKKKSGTNMTNLSGFLDSLTSKIHGGNKQASFVELAKSLNELATSGGEGSAAAAAALRAIKDGKHSDPAIRKGIDAVRNNGWTDSNKELDLNSAAGISEAVNVIGNSRVEKPTSAEIPRAIDSELEKVTGRKGAEGLSALSLAHSLAHDGITSANAMTKDYKDRFEKAAKLFGMDISTQDGIDKLVEKINVTVGNSSHMVSLAATTDAIIANGGIDDPEFGKLYKAARTSDERAKVIEQYNTKIQHKAFDRTIEDGVSKEAKKGSLDAAYSAAQELYKASENGNGVIDFTTYRDSTIKLDKAADKMTQAADRMLEAAGVKSTETLFGPQKSIQGGK